MDLLRSLLVESLPFPIRQGLELQAHVSTHTARIGAVDGHAAAASSSLESVIHGVLLKCPLPLDFAAFVACGLTVVSHSTFPGRTYRDHLT